MPSTIAIGQAVDAGRKAPFWRRMRRWALLGILFLLAALVLHRPLLRSFANFLVVHEPKEQVEALLLIDGDNRFDLAADLIQSGQARTILWVQLRPQRLQRLGILAPDEHVIAQELKRRTVPDEAFTLLPGAVDSDWARARVVRAWLERHPEAHINVLSAIYQTRRRRHIFHSVLGPDFSGRVHWCAMTKRRFHSDNWWQSKDGILNICENYVRFSFAVLVGEQVSDEEPWDPERYVKALSSS